MSLELKAVLIKPTTETLGVLEDSKVKVIQANDCLEGVRLIIRYRPDFVLSTIDLPDLSGLTMAKILYLLKVHTPLVLTDPKHNHQHEKRVEALPNVKGYFMESGIYYDLKSFIAKLQSVSPSAKDKEPPPKYEYSFKEREWASLMSRRKKKRILLIEEEELTRKALLIKLDGYTDYDLFMATNGLEGLTKALLIQPDLILSEIDLPEINGLAMSQILYILDKPFPVVFVTANDHKETKRKATHIEGVIGFLHKSRLPRKGFLVMAVQQYMHKAEKLAQSLGESYSKARANHLETEQASLF